MSNYEYDHHFINATSDLVRAHFERVLKAVSEAKVRFSFANDLYCLFVGSCNCCTFNIFCECLGALQEETALHGQTKAAAQQSKIAKSIFRFFFLFFILSFPPSFLNFSLFCVLSFAFLPPSFLASIDQPPQLRQQWRRIAAGGADGVRASDDTHCA